LQIRGRQPAHSAIKQAKHTLKVTAHREVDPAVRENLEQLQKFLTAQPVTDLRQSISDFAQQRGLSRTDLRAMADSVSTRIDGPWSHAEVLFGPLFVLAGMTAEKGLSLVTKGEKQSALKGSTRALPAVVVAATAIGVVHPRTTPFAKWRSDLNRQKGSLKAALLDARIPQKEVWSDSRPEKPSEQSSEDDEPQT
jgi:hypothetical protein